jgi:PAS domain S-box-containing protein
MIKDTRQYRILFVEDNPGDRIIFTEFLFENILSPVITYANNFKEAAQLLVDNDYEFDIILLDLHLPDRSGTALVNSMMSICPSCPIIILSGYADLNFSIQSITIGILDYLFKDDLDAASLYKSIAYTIERKKNIVALAASEKRYSDLFRLSPQPMWVYDIDTFMFLQVNEAAVKHYGFTEAEFLSMSIMDIRPQGEISKTKEYINFQGLNETATYKGTFIHTKKDGNDIEVDIYSTPILINNKKCKSVIAIDVTEKNLHESQITKAIIKTQEDERYEIGGELHDNVCQILATSLMSLGMIKAKMPPEKRIFLDECKSYISMALEEIRNLSHRLAPAFFDDSTLQEAFAELLHSFNPENKYKVALSFDKALINHGVGLDLQLNLYRILQEQLRNISRYANADMIKVEVALSGNNLSMEIADNGVGFNPELVKKGIGLSNMKRRVEVFSGNMEIISSPGNGCIIWVQIPLS